MHQILFHENIHFEKCFKNLTVRKSNDNIQRLENTLRSIFLMRVKVWQLFWKNGKWYLKTFCGRLISKKFYVLKTPWKSFPVNFKPEVTGNDDVIMTLWYYFVACDSLITKCVIWVIISNYDVIKVEKVMYHLFIYV